MDGELYAYFTEQFSDIRAWESPTGTYYVEGRLGDTPFVVRQSPTGTTVVTRDKKYLISTTIHAEAIDALRHFVDGREQEFRVSDLTRFVATVAQQIIYDAKK